MKLKILLFLKENSISSWDGIKEGKGWFMYHESNNWDIKRSGASVYVTEGQPEKYWIKIKTHGLRKPTDTNESYRQRVREYSGKVSRAWTTAAKRIHNDPHINEVGNEVPITWNQAFKEAIEDPKVKPFIENWGTEKIGVDPVNFTPRV